MPNVPYNLCITKAAVSYCARLANEPDAERFAAAERDSGTGKLYLHA